MARSLAAAGWVVGVASPRGRGLARVSRSVARWHPSEPPQAGLDAFVATVGAAISHGRYDVVFPGGDAELLALAYARDRLAAVVPYPAYESVERIVDKADVTRAAERAGIATPRWHVRGDLDAFPLPAVVKARRRWHPERSVPPERLHTVRVEDRDELGKRVAELRSAGAEPFVQEVISGDLVAYVVVLAPGGDVVAEFQQRAEGVWPPGAGVSTRARRMPVDPRLSERLLRLLADIGWWGLVEAQFLVDRDGSPYLLDLNARIYGSLALACAAGSNLPAAWGAVALGDMPDPALGGRPARYQWLEGDLRRALVERRGGLVRDLASSTAFAFGATHSIISPRDPFPAAVAAWEVVRRVLGRSV
jgi:predicted ATP-grasp superfamily ATP-dependent carboligase